MYDNDEVKSLLVMLPKTSAYVKSYDGQFKWMYFLIEDDGLLEKLILFRIVSADIKKEFDSKPVFLKISSHTCLAVISLASALKKDDNYQFTCALEYFKKHLNLLYQNSSNFLEAF